MQKIELTNNCIRTSIEDQSGSYVFYTGGIAGISDDGSTSQTDTESLNRRTNEIELDRH